MTNKEELRKQRALAIVDLIIKYHLSNNIFEKYMISAHIEIIRRTPLKSRFNKGCIVSPNRGGNND